MRTEARQETGGNYYERSDCTPVPLRFLTLSHFPQRKGRGQGLRPELANGCEGLYSSRSVTKARVRSSV